MMAATLDRNPEAALRRRHTGAHRVAGGQGAPHETPLLATWLWTQSINVTRHLEALRPFTRDEFGPGLAAPTEGHVQAVNDLMDSLRNDLIRLTKTVNAGAAAAIHEPTTRRLQQMVKSKEEAHRWVQAVEQVWDFYFELFGQRQSRYGEWLYGCDRIAIDCYQGAYMGLSRARSIPAPSPFSYMRTGFSPATFRRSIPLRRLGYQLNPFPLIQLPYHRLVNPWTLGAILHEVSHNLQNDLGLARALPRALAQRILQAGHPPRVAAAWTRWNRETFADLCALQLGGPAVVGSLMDVVGRSPATVLGYSPRGPHPTPYLRTFISTECLRRMGFTDDAEHYRRVWARIYPTTEGGTLPPALVQTAGEVIPLVVDTICYQPYPALGNQSLAGLLRFGPHRQQMIEEAARRLATGTDPGVIPERFLIGASRIALEQRLARPEVIADNFYRELARR